MKISKRRLQFPHRVRTALLTCQNVRLLENYFLDFVGVLAHLPKVVESLVEVLQGSLPEPSIFCRQQCQADFVVQFAKMRLMWHLRFVNRCLELQRTRKSVAARKIRKFV